MRWQVWMWHEWACSLVWAWLCPLSLLRGAGGENWERPNLPPPLRASWVPDVTTFAVPGSRVSSALSEHRGSVRASARDQGIERRSVALLLCRAHCDSPLADRQQNDWRCFRWACCVGMMFELLTVSDQEVPSIQRSGNGNNTCANTWVWWFLYWKVSVWMGT